MGLSFASLRDKVMELSLAADRLSSEVACASQDLKAVSYSLAQLTSGTRSGEEATAAVREAAKSMADAAAKISMVMRYCDYYLRHVQK